MFFSSFWTVLVAVILIFLVFIFYKKSKFFSRSTFFSVAIFIILSLIVGNAFNIYIIIPFWDKILHTLSGIIIIRCAKEFKKDNFFGLLCVFSSASLWEIWEFAGDKLLYLNSQNSSLDDTMFDMICASIGGIIGLIF